MKFKLRIKLYIGYPQLENFSLIFGVRIQFSDKQIRELRVINKHPSSIV